METRQSTFLSKIEVRRSGNRRFLDGKIIYGRFSEVLSDPRHGDFREVIAPGAFKSCLASGREIIALAAHDDKIPLASRSNGTLVIHDSADALSFSVELPESELASNLHAVISRGDIRGVSFGFIPTGDVWDDTQRPRLRRVIEAELLEISIAVPRPAYPSASAEAATRRLNPLAVAQARQIDDLCRELGICEYRDVKARKLADDRAWLDSICREFGIAL